MKSIEWGRLGLEMVVIVFSVLFALIVDDLRQDREELQLREAILLQLGAELERNQQVLEFRLPFHENLLASIDSAGATREVIEGALSDEQRAPAARFHLDPPLTASAWEAARASQAASGMEPGRLLVLSTQYSLQEKLVQSEMEIRAAYAELTRAGIEGRDDRFALHALSIALEELTGRERELCDEYRRMAVRFYDEPAAEGRCGSGNITFR